ncbi:DUF4222 domain-containing protein [Klebsiella aerogenes]|uniref:DUF4222 domain-containing protein n=1 Tax=Klebsiella aerogenes TaxID=548 RepID=UPI001F1E968A|nr:DUF4222 domain-containing protein [Klebsiella aerogenes]
MCKSQELLERWKKAQAGKPPVTESVPAAYIRPGTKYRDPRGRMVTVIIATQTRVTFRREGYQEICELSSSAFEKFTEVKS